MNPTIALLLGLVLLFFDAQAQSIVVGAERTDNYLTYLKNKKVGIIKNNIETLT